MSSDGRFIFLTVLASFGGSVIHCFRWDDLFNGAVAAIHSFRVYMEQINFGSSYWLRPATFLEDPCYAFDFSRAVYLFNHSNCSHPSLEVVYLFLFYGSHPFFEMWCVVFICCTTCCHLLSLIVICCVSLTFVFTRYHSLSLVVTIVTGCTTRCHSLVLNVPFVCLYINDPKKQSVALWEELRWNFMPAASLWKMLIPIGIRIIYFRKVPIGQRIGQLLHFLRKLIMDGYPQRRIQNSVQHLRWSFF